MTTAAVAGSHADHPDCRRAASPNTRSFRGRVGALKNLRPFLAMVWRTSPHLMAGSIALRLMRALLPVVTLYVGKLIIDDVVALVQMPGKPQNLQQWRDSGLLNVAGDTARLRVRACRAGRSAGTGGVSGRRPAVRAG